MRLFLFGLLVAAGLPLEQSTAAPPEADSAPGLPGYAGMIDRSVQPCDDFYKYACGTWLKNNPIPSDRARWARFDELQLRNETVLRAILEKDAAQPDAGSAIDRKIGLFYGGCIDVATVDRKGLGPLQPEFDRIRAIHDLPTLTSEVARLQRMGVDAIFSTSSGQDFKDATKVIAQIDQAGLGLPERDYYFKTDATSAGIRDNYVKHVARMFELMGDASDKAQADATTVMKMETELAKASMDVTSRRDPAKVYHPMTPDKVAALAPAFNWKLYLPDVHAEGQSINVAAPEFFTGMGAMLNRLSFDDWKTYLTWHLLSAESRWLPTKFADEHFNFYGKILTGQKEQQPRWKRCVQLTDSDLGEALGQAYVLQTFGAEGKARTLKIVNDIEAAMEQDITTVDWMTPETRKLAMEKLHAVANKIGYPDKWRDYSKVEVLPGDLVGNDQRATEFEFDRQMAKIGKPVDKTEWGMTPPTVNAYYDPQMNNINFPAGILQPPFYTASSDYATNYGAVGSVVGHELTHGFDDQGRQFDASGNFTDWWQPQDAKAYDTRAKCIEDEYGNFVVGPDVKQNGKLTEGENIADNGGVRLAYAAFSRLMAGEKLTEKDGYTPQQRFFLGFASMWCTNDTPQVRRLQATTNPHSLSEFRVNGTLVNMPEFAQAWSCKVGQPMAPKTNCRVW